MSLKIFEMGSVQHPLASADPHCTHVLSDLPTALEKLIHYCSAARTALQPREGREGKDDFSRAHHCANAHFVHHLLGYKINFSA